MILFDILTFLFSKRILICERLYSGIRLDKALSNLLKANSKGFEEGFLSPLSSKVITASNQVNNFIKFWQKKLSISAKNTFLIGFSQGSMVALETGSKNKIGGLICYSGSFINNNYNLTKEHKIMLVHGELDETIPIDSMKKAKNDLLKLGADVDSYICKNLGHSINEEGIKIGIEFIKRCK